jgi:hypothetical protein
MNLWNLLSCIRISGNSCFAEICMPRAIQIRRTPITSPELTPPVGPFSQAIEVGGFIYFSGQVGQDPTTIRSFLRTP